MEWTLENEFYFCLYVILCHCFEIMGVKFPMREQLYM